jgi:cell division protein FtsB
VLLLGLLGGGLMCLLVVNTTLAANSIEINQLQQDNAATTQRIQQLQQDVAARGSAAVISKEARKLGMRPVQVPTFINLRTRASLSAIRPGDHVHHGPMR